MSEQVDVLVIGAGPAGSSAARLAAQGGVRVLLVEQRPQIGLPVQCAEYIPAQIVQYVGVVPQRCIAQRIQTMRTYLPDGTHTETPAVGYVVERALFDKALAVAARRAGAAVWTGARAVERTELGALLRLGSRTLEVEAKVVIGADGPRSTVGRWIGQENKAHIDARQVEVVLRDPRPTTEIYFDPAYPGGYGWLFPKGDTANVGVGVSREMGGDPREALMHLLARIEIELTAIVSRTGGLVPSGGEVDRLQSGSVLLVGDAAGATHPITGAGIANAVIGGTLAGQAAVRAVRAGDLTVLDTYEREWSSFMRGPLRHALDKRQYLDQHWSNDRVALTRVLGENWIAFKEYGRRARGWSGEQKRRSRPP